MKTLSQVLAGISLIFVLLSFTPIPLLPFIPIALSLIFILVTLLLGLLIKNKLIWVSSLVMLLSTPISIYLQEQQSSQYLFNTCKQFIIDGRWQISDYIVEESNLAFLYNSDQRDSMVTELQRLSSVAKQVDATARALGASPQEISEQICLAVLKECTPKATPKAPTATTKEAENAQENTEK